MGRSRVDVNVQAHLIDHGDHEGGVGSKVYSCAIGRGSRAIGQEVDATMVID